MKNFYKILLVALLVVLGVGGVGLTAGVSNIDAQTNKDRHNGVIVDHDADINGDLDVDGTTNLDVVDIDGAVDMATTATVGTGLVVTSGGATITAGATTVGGLLVLDSQAEVVTATFILTPAKPYIVMTSDAAYTSDTTTPIVAAGATTGSVIVVQNGNASDALTIDGTGGTVECKANLVLGSLDTATFLFDGTQWVCLSLYDNS